MKDDLASTVEELDDFTRDLLPHIIENGVLIPLKTSLELRGDHATSQAFITRAPTKSANAVLSLLRNMLPEETVKGVPHLRRCAKPCDLPAHLKSQFMNETTGSRHIHTGKSNWIYIMLGPAAVLSREELATALSKVEGLDDVFITTIPIPLLAPTSQVQAALWSLQFWPAVYRKNNPLGPHPSMVSRATDEIADDAAVWMSLAHRIAEKSRKAGHGEPIGACIIQRDGTQTQVVALAADARWHDGLAIGCTGNPMGHAVLRAISMVAQKLVRAEGGEEQPTEGGPPVMGGFDAFQDRPLLDDEQKVLDAEHPSPDGYLCHGLELYMTHEPCVMCSMAILHSRMGKAVFAHRMPLTGGLCSEERTAPPHRAASAGGGPGLGLFWRRELNWSLLAWEWEPSTSLQALAVDPGIHA